MTAATYRISRRLAFLLAVAAAVGLGAFGVTRMLIPHAKSLETTGAVKAELPRYVPTAAEWASLTVEPVTERVFRAEHATEGKIAVNEDSSTPIFSPFAGRVTKLLVKPSDRVERGQPLFIVEAADTVQGLNDFITALSALNSARSKLNLAQIVEKRANDLYAGKAVPLKDWQQSQSDLTTAQNDMRSAETALEAAHNRLRILGRSEEQIASFQETRQISADTPIYSPIERDGRPAQGRSGSVHQQRRQRSGIRDRRSLDGVACWPLCGRPRRPGWPSARRSHSRCWPCRVASSRRASTTSRPAIDPATRRLLVRATIDNKDGVLQARDVRQCDDLFGRRSCFGWRAKTGADL